MHIIFKFTYIQFSQLFLRLPKLGIIQVEHWLRTDRLENDENVNENQLEKDEVGIVNVDQDNEILADKVNDYNSVVVQISQLKVLFYQCYLCGHSINETALQSENKRRHAVCKLLVFKL